MTSRDIAATVESELRAIERRVFEDVWISTARARVVAALATGLAATAVVLQATGEVPAGATRNGHWISLVATALFTLAASVSAFALVRRRFRWCCLATCASALASVDGAGAFWWHHTAHTASWVPAAVGTLSAAALTATWLGICLVPLDSSQPDMRAAPAGAGG
ncbi:hypothetical protein [Mycolicibacterium neworleansense]|uniref:Transmembrane protein n=1 Tax=Mycolicibacterium neworleansense TaxID=146018 RepID=A0A0H5RHE6_9MYCO|nr:hypothetical protein [Mycolicibacterium neworleansense]MCV7362185.1 hypothetical protein [Mycolicibacterium neworleansense]CRZ13408.1 hypothetical protein BN2156_00241 [Mycolicibacterium neworleansense]